MQALANPLATVELARFNIELNTPPRPLGGVALRERVRTGVGLAQAEAQGLVAAGDAVAVAGKHLGVQVPQHRR